MKRIISTVVFSLSISTFLLGCSGGSGSSSSSSGATTQTPATVTGVFLDSPVAGLSYSTASQQGTTNAAGEFTYRNGETVTFRLGTTSLGSATGAQQVTPLTLVQAADLEAARQSGVGNRLTNILLLLQSLDADGNPDNGIDLARLTDQFDAALDFDLDPSVFQNTELRELVNRFSGKYRSPQQVTNHFLQSLNQTVSVSLPLRSEIDIDGDGTIDTTVDFVHDALGRVIEITTTGNGASNVQLEYNEQGLLQRIIEDRTNSSIVVGFPLFSPNSLSVVETVYEYDTDGRVVSVTTIIDDEIVRTAESTYDDVGNLTRRTSNGSGLISQAVGSYLQHYLLAFGVVPPPSPVSFIAIPNIDSEGLTGAISGNQGGVITGGVAISTTELVTDFEYDDLGNLIRQVFTIGDQVSEFLFDVTDEQSARLCQSLQAAISASVTLLPVPFDCSGVEIELDSRGRPLQITNTSSNVVTDTFAYEGALLTSQTTQIESQTGELLSSYERRYSYDATGNIVEGTRVENGVVTYRLTRSYDTVELDQLP